MKLRGLENVLGNIEKAVAEAGEATEEGLYAAGLIIEKDSIKRTPRDTGHLRNTAYVNAQGKKVQVGYSAEYAPAVHENLNAHHGVGEPKFLEHAAQAREKEALAAVADAIKAAID